MKSPSGDGGFFSYTNSKTTQKQERRSEKGRGIESTLRGYEQLEEFKELGAASSPPVLDPCSSADGS